MLSHVPLGSRAAKFVYFRRHTGAGSSCRGRSVDRLSMESQELEDGGVVIDSWGRGEVATLCGAWDRVGGLWWRHIVRWWAVGIVVASQSACDWIAFRLAPCSPLMGQRGPSLASLTTSLRGHQGCPEIIRFMYLYTMFCKDTDQEMPRSRYVSYERREVFRITHQNI